MLHRKKDNQKAFIVKKLAAKHGLKTDMIYKILRGDRDNETILTEYMTMKEDIDEAVEKIQDNPLMKAVLNVCPL